jgi:hypothetical protein
MELRGKALEIGSNGEMVIETEEGKLIPVIAGDVSVRGLMGYI